MSPAFKSEGNPSAILGRLSRETRERAEEIAYRAPAGCFPTEWDGFQLKSLLKKELPLKEAFHAYRLLLNLGDGVRLESMQVRSLLDVARAEGLSFEVLHPGGEIVTCDPPQIFGRGEAQKVVGKTRTVFAARFKNAQVQSRSGAIRVDSGLLYDFQGDEFEGLSIDYSYDPLIFHHDDAVDVIIDERSSTVLHVDRAWSLVGIFSGNFGHWMVEGILKFLGARHLANFSGIPLLIDDSMPHQHRQLLDVFAGEFPIIPVSRGTRVHAQELWLTSNWTVSYPLLKNASGISPQVAPASKIASLFRSAGVQVDDKLGLGRPGKRTFLTRSPNLRRKLSNCKRISALLKRQGFIPYTPECHPYCDQLRTIRESSKIAIQAGSSLIGVLFARPGTEIIYLSHPYLDALVPLMHVLSELELDIKVVAGVVKRTHVHYDDWSDYEVPVDALEKALGVRASALNKFARWVSNGD